MPGALLSGPYGVLFTLRWGRPPGGTVGFWIASKLGHDFVASKLKLGGTGVIKNTRFGFSVVFLLGLIPAMPVTVIN